jgi:hypothetical protein
LLYLISFPFPQSKGLAHNCRIAVLNFKGVDPGYRTRKFKWLPRFSTSTKTYRRIYPTEKKYSVKPLSYFYDTARTVPMIIDVGGKLLIV